MFYGYVGQVPPGYATQRILADSFWLIALYTFCHWYVFKDLSHWLVMNALYLTGSQTLIDMIRWTFSVLTWENEWGMPEYDLGASTKMACTVWLITTPIILVWRRLQNIIDNL